uniref:Uncharacterized protein n=1 Tax=Lepeophtheirus salmonis TaxID=72036 RepID=A0A0K2TFE1_LEPSM
MNVNVGEDSQEEVHQTKNVLKSTTKYCSILFFLG